MEQHGEDNMDKTNFLIQIEKACRSLSNKEDEIIFMTVNPTTKASYCIASQVGMDFLNGNIRIVDSEESNFVKLFNGFVKDYYGVTETDFRIHQKTIQKSTEHDKDTGFSPFDMFIVNSDQTDINQSKSSTASDILSMEYEAANQKATNEKYEKLDCPDKHVKDVEAVVMGNQKTIKPTNEEQETPKSKQIETNVVRQEDTEQSNSCNITESTKQQEKKRGNIPSGSQTESVKEFVKKTAKPKNESTEKTKSSQRSEVKSTRNDTPGAKTRMSASFETPKAAKSVVKPQHSTGVVTSRSGRRVKIPKWRLEDIGDVKEIKVEPRDDEDYGIMKKTEKEVGKNVYVGKEKKSSTRTKQKGVLNNKEVSNNEKLEENSSEGKELPTTRSNDSTTRESLKSSKRKLDSSEDSFAEVKRKCEKNEHNSTIDHSLHDVDEKIDNVFSDDTEKSEIQLQNIKMEVDMLKAEVGKDDNINETVESLIYESIVGDAKDEPDDQELKDDIDLEDEEEELKNDLDIDIDSKNSGIWSCGICNNKAKKCWLVRRHMRRMHDLGNKDLKPCRYCKMVKVYEECEECPEKVDNLKLTCETCEKTFTSKFQFVRHQECHITEKEFPCNLCGKKFKSERYVKMHIYHTHKKRNGKALTTQMEPGICDICGKWFRFKCNAVRHREIHFEEKRFDCPICHMKFRHSSSLKRHKLSHQQKAEYVCEQCGRSFKMKQTLIQHHRVHVKEPFLKCEYCPREFRTYKGKKYHILKDHSDKAGDFNFKSFVCEICEKPSSSRAEYEEHQKTHDASRAHVCSICGSRWTTVAQLKAHKKSHNLTPHRYRCKVCNIPFKEASKARLHILKESHIKNCLAVGLDQSKDNISDITNSEIIEIIEYEYDYLEATDQELQQELVTTAVDQMEGIPEEIKVIHIEQSEFGTNTAEVQILNEAGNEIMYDEIILPQEEITMDGEQVIYQVEIDGQNAIICDTLTSQAVESILKLQSQS